MKRVTFGEGPRLLASVRFRWINVEKRRDGHYPAAEWFDPQELRAFPHAPKN